MINIFSHNISDLSAKYIMQSVIPFPYNRGLTFANAYKYILQSQWWPIGKLEEFQNERLASIIQHAYTNVPYYRDIFMERGLKPSNINDKSDLSKLPILTKDDIRKNFNSMVAVNRAKYKAEIRHTSGSTGEPLSYYIDKKLSILINAYVYRHWKWCGINSQDKIAVFRGTLIGKYGRKKKCLYRINGNQIHFSTFEMNNEVMMQYVESYNRFKPGLVRGYPTSLEIFARFIDDNNIKIHSPKAIHTSSEVVLPAQKKLLETVFRSPLFDWYGHGESTVCAGECDRHKGLHLNSEFGCTEFLKTDLNEEGKNVYQVISTSLWNYSMPIIRYDTEDMAILSDHNCPCGRELPLIERIIGRKADIIYGINGVNISPSSLVHYWKYRVADKLPNMKYAQIIQEQPDCLLVKLVCTSKEQLYEKIIHEQLCAILGDMNIRYEYLSEIPTGQKWRFTISSMDK